MSITVTGEENNLIKDDIRTIISIMIMMVYSNSEQTTVLTVNAILLLQTFTIIMKIIMKSNLSCHYVHHYH